MMNVFTCTSTFRLQGEYGLKWNETWIVFTLIIIYLNGVEGIKRMNETRVLSLIRILSFNEIAILWYTNETFLNSKRESET